MDLTTLEEEFERLTKDRLDVQTIDEAKRDAPNAGANEEERWRKGLQCH